MITVIAFLRAFSYFTGLTAEMVFARKGTALCEPMASPTWSDLLQTIKEKKYRVSADYLLREIAGEYAIIPVGAACQISNAVMVPNDTAVFLWNTFQQPHTISEVVAQAAEEYEAPEEKIQDSVLNFVHDTLKYQLLEEVVSL